MKDSMLKRDTSETIKPSDNDQEEENSAQNMQYFEFQKDQSLLGSRVGLPGASSQELLDADANH